MRISVVICTRNRHDLIGQSVESVAQCDWPCFDIHVMDQSTSDETQRIVEALALRFGSAPEVVYHHLDRAGLSGAYNAGIGASAGQIVAFTDDDVVVPRDWLARIAEAFAREPDAGLLYGQVLVPESLRDAPSRGLIVPGLTFERAERFDRARGFRVFGMGANFAIRRDVVARSGGFDEVLGGGGPLRSSQDFDFAYRVWRAGSAVLLEPAVKVDHYGTRTNDQWPATMMNYGIGDGGFYFKHVRCGDLRALGYLMSRLVRSWARETRSVLRQRKWTPDPYGRYLWQGIRESRRYQVDRRSRLYVTPRDMVLPETQANLVTAAHRTGDGGTGDA